MRNFRTFWSLSFFSFSVGLLFRNNLSNYGYSVRFLTSTVENVVFRSFRRTSVAVIEGTLSVSPLFSCSLSGNSFTKTLRREIHPRADYLVTIPIRLRWGSMSSSSSSKRFLTRDPPFTSSFLIVDSVLTDCPYQILPRTFPPSLLHSESFDIPMFRR